MHQDLPEAFYVFFVEGYSYFGLPFENFAIFHESHRGDFNVGIGFFRPVLSIVGEGPLVDRMLDRSGFAPLFGFVNTYPFITLIDAELGVIGVLIIPILYGLFVSYFYVRFRNSPNCGTLFSYIVVALPWLWLFATAGYTILTLYLNLLFVFVLYGLLFRLRKRETVPRGMTVPGQGQSRSVRGGKLAGRSSA